MGKGSHPKTSLHRSGTDGSFSCQYILILADSIIRDRIVFRKAAKEGLSVVEMDDPKAKAEIMALFL